MKNYLFIALIFVSIFLTGILGNVSYADVYYQEFGWREKNLAANTVCDYVDEYIPKGPNYSRQACYEYFSDKMKTMLETSTGGFSAVQKQHLYGDPPVDALDLYKNKNRPDAFILLTLNNGNFAIYTNRRQNNKQGVVIFGKTSGLWLPEGVRY
ncbi:MAG: hypothetical protein MI862_12800 [Desulfobacterales bacterium]|nr:hypothetical protein [Desulfobacterales bacterium]